MKKSKLITKKSLKDEPLLLPESNPDRSYSNPISDGNFSFGEDKEYKQNPVASKFSFDLFSEETALIATPVVRIKHTRDKWRFYYDNKNIFTLDGTKLSKKEKQFLQSVEGAQFLLTQSKYNSLTVSGIKKEMKSKLKKLSVKSKSPVR